ncbi:MAG: serine/threonine-protein kinase [Nannocystaceae bacterium]
MTGDESQSGPVTERLTSATHPTPTGHTTHTTRSMPTYTTPVPGDSMHGDASARLHSGDVLDGKYRLESLIGRGGTGAVWRCTHLHMGGEVALKIVIDRLRNKPQVIERFWQEARIMGEIGHPNIVRIFDVSPPQAEVPYMAMELLLHRSLRERLKIDRKVPPEEAIRLLDGVLSALIAAHKRAIIHRDIKPENLMFAPVRDLATDEVRTELKVLDFGASMLVDPDTAAEALDGLVGTPYYMSPEQAGGGALDHRSDLYSAAVVLYEMICGKHPHEGDGLHSLVLSIATEPPIPLRRREPELPDVYYAFFDRALAVLPADRFQSAEEMRAALRQLSGQLARLERHTELYLSAIPDLPTPVPLSALPPRRLTNPIAETAEDVAQLVEREPSQDHTAAAPLPSPAPSMGLVIGVALTLGIATAFVVGQLGGIGSSEIQWAQVFAAWALTTVLAIGVGSWLRRR